MSEEKKVNTTEEAKKDVKVEENSEKLNDEQMAQVTGGKTLPIEIPKVPVE